MSEPATPLRPPWLANNKALGAWGEEQAARLLQQRGLVILQRNWRCRFGEIDLIAVQKGELVFAEVKTRRILSAGTPEEALTAAKSRQLVRMAKLYLAELDMDPPWRIDLIAVECDHGGLLTRCEHIPCAVWGW